MKTLTITTGLILIAFIVAVSPVLGDEDMDPAPLGFKFGMSDGDAKKKIKCTHQI